MAELFANGTRGPAAILSKAELAKITIYDTTESGLSVIVHNLLVDRKIGRQKNPGESRVNGGSTSLYDELKSRIQANSTNSIKSVPYHIQRIGILISRHHKGSCGAPKGFFSTRKRRISLRQEKNCSTDRGGKEEIPWRSEP